MSEMILRQNQALSDRYVVERRLGEGRMATAYLAHDRRHDRRVAIKVLTTPSATDCAEASPGVSRNGRWLAYVSNRTGQAEVYVRPIRPLDGEEENEVELIVIENFFEVLRARLSG